VCRGRSCPSQIVTSNSVSNNAGGLKEKTATCPSVKKVVGGGAQPISSPAYYAAGYPVGDNAFHAIGSSPAGPAFSVRAFAICATVAGSGRSREAAATIRGLPS
jgi:hypothetical protein